MSIWNKVLLGLIIVAVLPFLYYGARTLQTHKHWMELAQAYQTKVDEAEKRNEILEFGDPQDPAVQGLNQVRLETHKFLIDRGRVWRDVTPAQVDPQTGQVRVTVDFPEPHGIGEKTILYAFEQGPAEEGGRYLGEFKVVALNNKEISLEPTRSLREPLPQGNTWNPLQRLVQSRGPWILYDLMPIDSHETFAGLSPEELKAILPEDTLAQYLKDGQPAGPDDPERYVVDGKYVRPLRDYDSLFKSYDLHRTRVFDLIESWGRDKAYMEQAVADATKQQAETEQQVAALKTELAEIRREVDAVAAHRKQLEQTLGQIQKEIDEAIASNQALAAEIARLQQEAARGSQPESEGDAASDRVAAAP